MTANAAFGRNGSCDLLECGGGAIAAAGTSTLLARGICPLSNNWADNVGGAIFLAGLASAKVTSEISFNAALRHGGGIASIEQSSLILDYGADFRHNKAGLYGGGIYAAGSSLIVGGCIPVDYIVYLSIKL